jgi:hypothetical protein
MMTIFRETLAHALMITGFVFVMMLVIEYLNVLTRGVWQQGLRGSRWQQYLLASLLGAAPGCLGAFTVVSLYSHRVVSLGAVVAAMIATSGDESFVMLSMIPGTAGFIFLVLFVTGLTAGVLTDVLLGKRVTRWAAVGHELDLHDEGACDCFPRGQIVRQWKDCSLARGTLVLIHGLFIFGLLAGYLGPSTWNWIRLTLLLTSGAGLFIVATVPEDFLEKHLWKHVVQKHVPRIFLWTFGALLVMHVMVDQLQLADWMQENRLLMLLAACLVGLVPESGPHLVFLTLYVQGAVPFSVLLASSIVQDGHGMLPLLADSRMSFVVVKTINLAIGLLIGFAGYLIGW